MARQYGSYSLTVPLGINWLEPIVLQDSAGAPVDISNHQLRCQFYAEKPTRDPADGFATVDPVFELISQGAAYQTAPAWPVYEGLSFTTDGTDGALQVDMTVDQLWIASPDNAKRKLVWEIQLWNPADNETLPVVNGKVTFLQCTTMRPNPAGP